MTKDRQPAYQVLKDLQNEWEDALTLASSSPRMSLPPQINHLQQIKQKVESQEWNECSTSAVELLKQSMGSTIQGFITFLNPDNSESLSNSYLEKAQSKMYQFIKENLNLIPRKERLILLQEDDEKR